jgi:hypothetical protein
MSNPLICYMKILLLKQLVTIFNLTYLTPRSWIGVPLCVCVCVLFSNWENGAILLRLREKSSFGFFFPIRREKREAAQAHLFFNSHSEFLCLDLCCSQCVPTCSQLVPQPDNTSLYPISFALSSSPVTYITGLKRRLQQIYFGIVWGLIKFLVMNQTKKCPLQQRKKKKNWTLGTFATK